MPLTDEQIADGWIEVNGTPSARITGDKDRENPVEGAHTAPSGDEVERVARAIEAAQCKGREGPFGGYDYGHNTAFYGPEPEGGRYVIRDFRDPASPDWGKWLHQTNDSEDHERMFAKMTREHIAQAAIRAITTEGTDK